MPPIQAILRAVFLAVVITVSLTGIIAEFTRRKPKQAVSWPPKRWALRLAAWSLVLDFVLLALYLAHVPSFTYVDGKWVAGSRDVWHVAFLGAVTFSVFAVLLDRLIRLAGDPRVPLIRRLARANVLVLAVVVASLALYPLVARD